MCSHTCSEAIGHRLPSLTTLLPWHRASHWIWSWDGSLQAPALFLFLTALGLQAPTRGRIGCLTWVLGTWIRLIALCTAGVLATELFTGPSLFFFDVNISQATCKWALQNNPSAKDSGMSVGPWHLSQAHTYSFIHPLYWRITRQAGLHLFNLYPSRSSGFDVYTRRMPTPQSKAPARPQPEHPCALPLSPWADAQCAVCHLHVWKCTVLCCCLQVCHW